MAKKPQPALAGIETIDDDAHYVVKMAKPYTYHTITLRPGHDPVLKGRVIKEIADYVAEFQPVAG